MSKTYDRILIVIKALQPQSSHPYSIEDFAYSLSIAEHYLDQWEKPREKDLSRQMKSIHNTALKLGSNLDLKKLLKMYKKFEVLPKEVQILYLSDGKDGLKSFLVSAVEINNGKQFSIDNKGLESFIKASELAIKIREKRSIGNKNKPITDYVTQRSKYIFEVVTGQIATINSEKKADGVSRKNSDFIKFLKEIFDILEINANELHYSRRLIHLRN